MKVIHIHPAAPPKPALGAACNGCGVCCLTAPCPVGMVVSRRRHGACAALRWSDAQGRYLCGMLGTPALALRWPLLAHWPARLWTRLARRWIAAGVGCDADVELGDVDARDVKAGVIKAGGTEAGGVPPPQRPSKSTTHV